MAVAPGYLAGLSAVTAGAGSNAFTAQAAQLATDLAGDPSDTGELPMVKLGDASIAAPFTSKLPSIRSTLDIIRQGRCTLVSTIQMQQVLALECLISAYSMSALYLDGVSKAENQLVATGLLLMVASLAFSYARPVQRLSPVRPITSLFHPAIWVSIAGQLAIHLGSMMYIINLARSILTQHELSVLDGDVVELDEVAPPPPPPLDLPGGPPPDSEGFTRPFKPSLLNTVVFLVQTAQQAAVMLVNYKGRPFMLAATENAAMGASLVATTAGVFICAFEVFPWLNDLLKLVPLPSDEFRNQMLTSLFVSVFGSMVWDRLCVAIFAPKLLWVGYVDAWKALPPREYWAENGKKLTYILAVLTLYQALDQSIAILLGGWWGWRQIFAPKPPVCMPHKVPNCPECFAGLLPPAPGQAQQHAPAQTASATGASGRRR